MFGCESAATARASRANRSRSALGASILTATRRSSSSSSASQTALIEPRPSGSINRYRPAITSSAMPPGLSCATVADLLTIDEALADRARARARRWPAEAVAVRDARGPRSRRGGRRRRRPAAVRQLGDGRLCGARRRHARASFGSSATRPPARPPKSRSRPGEAIEISTGAVVPAGADAVVPVERTQPGVTVEGGTRRRERTAARRRCPHAATRSSPPARSSARRSSGLSRLRVSSTVSCARRPRVAVLATGNELRPPGSRARARARSTSRTRCCSRRSLRAQARSRTRFEPAADDEARDARRSGACARRRRRRAHLRRRLGRPARSRACARSPRWARPSSSGASRSSRESRIAFSTLGSTLVFGLPGNPVSSLVGFELFVRPALRALQGEREPRPALSAGRARRTRASRSPIATS